MTTIEQIRMARQEMDMAFAALLLAVGVKHALDAKVALESVQRMIAIQAAALRQATDVAEENFERAQKLADQVQDNVKHMELLSENLKLVTEFMRREGYAFAKNAQGRIDVIFGREIGGTQP